VTAAKITHVPGAGACTRTPDPFQPPHPNHERLRCRQGTLMPEQNLFKRHLLTRRIPTVRVLSVALLLGAAIPAHAQYLGLNLRGDTGLKSGSQPGPGYYFALPLYYRSDYSTLKLPNGNTAPGDYGVGVGLLAPVVAVTTNWKILGANYGFQIVPTFMGNRQSLAGGAVEKNLGYGEADTYIQPINLGWHTKRADFLGAYGFYAPTGPRTLDMWAHEMVAGTTVYFDDAKSWHVAATMFYDINQRKRSRDIKVGQYMTIEGGVGRSFLKGVASTGMAYVMQWKTTNDSGADIPPLLPRGKNTAYGLGPEINMPLFAKGKFMGFVGLRYTFEFANSTNFQGRNLAVTLTLARLR